MMKMTSRLALVAAAGVLLGAAITPAKAADLGGGCCADLEERVAELEATTARKGNRVVSLQIYGQIVKGLMIWDDGVDSDAFIVDNDAVGSRFGFTGKATIKPGWTAGYLMEFAVQDANSAAVNNGSFNSDGDFVSGKNGDDLPATSSEFTIRHNNLWIESEKLGRVTIGQASTAADGAHGVNLSNSLRGPSPDHGPSFAIRLTDGGYSTVTLGDLATDLDAPRDDIVRYDSPSIYGFIVSTSWGDNDYWDAALRFKKEWNSIRIAAALAYQWDGTEDSGGNRDKDSSFEVLGGSISVMHIPTGIYGAFTAAEKEWDDYDGEASYWYAQAGIEKKWLPYGSTTIYGEYGVYDGFAQNKFDELGADSEAERWGFGVVQKFDSAALEVYAQATFWSFDGVDVNVNESPVSQDLEDFSTIMIGSRIKF